MKTFIYKAKQGPGKTVEGELRAVSITAAQTELDAKGLVPVWVREKESSDAGSGNGRASGRQARRNDVTTFTRQLASLIKPGVPILKALSTVAGQTELPAFRKVVQDMESYIRDGHMLSEAMAKYPDLFSELYISMIRAGESGGVLDTMLTRLAEARESEDETRRKIQAAIAYPMLIICVGVFTVFVLLTFFLPRLVKLFRDYEDLPMPTKVLISLTDFFSGNWYWILLMGFLVYAIFRRLAAMETGRILVDSLKLRLPLFGTLLKRSDIARFARTLALLTDSGIAIDKALTLSAATLRNAVLKAEIEKVRKSTISQGMPLSAGLARSQNFPAFVSNMIAVGEEAGNIEESLAEIALFYEKDVEQKSKLATSLLEPALILVVGGMVGFIVAAMLLPIFELGTNL